jgi:hypothetical protein
VAYAGNNNPDGHSARVMGSDGYYAELTSTWSGPGGCSQSPDQATLLEPAGAMNTFCTPSFPSTVELEIGRVDMAGLPAFSASELNLLRAYLTKAHRFKVKQWEPQRRIYSKDRLGDALGSAYTTGLGPWSGYTALVAPNAITIDNSGSSQMPVLLDGQSHLYTLGTAYGANCTGGANDVVGSTASAVTRAWGGVFNFSLGSYFGEFNCSNGFLRGLLASGDALTMAYNSLQWFPHAMGMGQTIGATTRAMMNNALTGVYEPLSANISSNANTHLVLMGDPTLRNQYLAPPGPVSVSNAGGVARVQWQPSPEVNLDGYHVYRVTSAGHQRLTTSPLTGTTFTTQVPYTAGDRFLVRAIQTTTTPSGVYRLPSIGTLGTAP